MAEHNDLGRKGEDIAAEYLVSHGFRIVEKNWKFDRNEIDIIAVEGNQVVILEVKTRQSNSFLEPEMSVTKDKQRALIRAANAYVRFKRMKQEVRFDIMTILITGEQAHINHIQDAFYPTLR
jgi:putative endonuclease